MLVEWLITGRESKWNELNYRDGGYVYDTSARIALHKCCQLEVTYLCRGNSQIPIRRTLEFIHFLARCRTIDFKGQVVVRDFFSTLFAPFDRSRKNAILVHHIDSSVIRNRRLFDFLVQGFFIRARKADAIVVVSEYWKEMFVRSGCKNVHVIYNSFNTDQFDIRPDEIAAFAQAYSFDLTRPIIYLGNAKIEKGFLDAFEHLKEINADFVCTGNGASSPPLRQLFLNYRDYLILLKISSIALTMSKFNEGWCRTAHEAMLCGTPVVGSGRGGMRELLIKGKQIVCPDFREIRKIVERLLQDDAARKRIGLAGKRYAQEFSQAYFEKSWTNFISDLVGPA